jgi:hypothetical protein
VESERVDGVPVFWTKSGDEMRAGLMFRAGRADESLARGGITHMIEHLALYPLAFFGLILGASAAQFARSRLLTRAAQQNARRY